MIAHELGTHVVLISIRNDKQHPILLNDPVFLGMIRIPSSLRTALTIACESLSILRSLIAFLIVLHGVQREKSVGAYGLDLLFFDLRKSEETANLSLCQSKGDRRFHGAGLRRVELGLRTAKL